MSKGQKRSNREVKKPKQVKPKTPVAAPTVMSRMAESRDRPKKSKH